MRNQKVSFPKMHKKKSGSMAFKLEIRRYKLDRNAKGEKEVRKGEEKVCRLKAQYLIKRSEESLR